jgi:hypothetical protein
MAAFQEGTNKGRVWAREKAKKWQLLALQRAHLLIGELGDGLAWHLYCCLHGMDADRDDVDSDLVERFWFAILGEGGDMAIEDVQFAKGFCDGALDVLCMNPFDPAAKRTPVA